MRVFKWVMPTVDFLRVTNGWCSPVVKSLVCSLMSYPRVPRDWTYRVEEQGDLTSVTLVTRGSVPGEPPTGSIREVAVPEGFTGHDTYRIRVDWVAERNLPAAGAKRGALELLFRRDKAEEALGESLKRRGVQVEQVLRSSINNVVNPKKDIGRIPVLSFEAVVSVSNRQAFQELLENGLGSLKSYGFGLVIPRPV